MYNWSVDTTQLKKDPKRYTIWHLERLINFGLNGEKISRKDLNHYFTQLHIEPRKKRYLKLLLQS